ncbi:AAA family ATPase [Brevundimonas sp.]|uniref:AAA family ATPase n=1 Tax=Brevundimonas sp. TaxID=1871086 RepID=UPI00289693E1|nr:AAA family ATPase [Brevundimonas sp.]
MPRDLFPASYLRELFFETGPRSWRLDIATIRKGMKYYAKKVDHRRLDDISSEITAADRDARMIEIICDDEKLRQSFHTIELGSTKHRKPLKLASLPETLWRLGFWYSSDPNLEDLAKWFRDAASTSHRPIGSRLTADAFETAFRAAPPNIALNDTDLARAIVLFAARLDAAGRDELLRRAVSLGAVLPASCDPDQALTVSEEPVAMCELASAVASPPSLPRLTGSERSTPVPPPLSDEARQQLEDLQKATVSSQAVAEATSAQFKAGLVQLVEGPAPDFDRAVSSLTAWRVEETSRLEIEKALRARVDVVRQALEDRFDLTVMPATGSNLSEAVEMAEGAVWASGFFDTELEVFRRWQSGLGASVELGRFLELAGVEAERDAAARAEEIFGEELKTALPNFQPTTVAAWLPELNARELVYLTQRADALGGTVLRALLIAYGVERHGAIFAEQAAMDVLVALAPDARRSALRFIQRSSARLDGAPTFRRFVCREHLAGLLVAGPLAQIADVSVGTTDTCVVGRNLVIAVEAVVANLDIVSSAADIRRRLATSRAAGENTAAMAAVNFIKTPAGMSGHFRRLREVVREKVLLPLVSGETLSIRQAKEALRFIMSGEAEVEIFDEVDRGLSGGDKLESQHRLQLNRYLQTAAKQLDAAVRAEASKADARTVEFADRLDAALSNMATDGPPGSIEWLEGEFRALLERSDGADVLAPSLMGGEEALMDRRWTAEDEGWRDPAISSVEFYRADPAPLWTILCSLAAHGPGDPERIVANLLSEENFSGALQAALDAGRRTPTLKVLRKRVEEAASPKLRETRAQLEELERLHGRDLKASEAFDLLRDALVRLRVDDAREYAAILQQDMETLTEQAHREATETEDRIASADLLARLLRVGDATPPSDTSLPALKRRWAEVIMQSAARRRHLIAVEAMLGPIGPEMPEFAPLLPRIEELSARSEDPDWWLSEEASGELVGYLSGTFERLGSWTAVLGILTSEHRRDLGVLLSAFLSFFYERTDALRTASKLGEIETVLEDVIEFELVVASQSGAPLDCLKALAEAGLTEIEDIDALERRQMGMVVVHGRRQSEDLAKAVANAVANRAWPELNQLAHNVRASVAEDEVQRIDDIADFAKAMGFLAQNDRRAAYPILDGAARALSASGHPIHRALSARDRNAAILRILYSALHGGETVATVPDPASWAELLAAHPDLFRFEDAASDQLTLVMSAVFGGAQAFEAGDQVWVGSANLPDVRADLLIFLHDQGQTDAIVRLCAKHDSAIKAKLEQVLELRNASIGRPDLVHVAEALGSQVAAAAKTAGFRQFIKRLPSAVQPSQGSLRVDLQDDLVFRGGPYSRIPIQISVTVVPDGIVPNELHVQLIAEDDVSFAGRSGRVMLLTEELLYAAKDVVISLVLGESWEERIKQGHGASLRLRFSARTVTDSIVTTDLDVPIVAAALEHAGPSIDVDTLLEYYPGVGNTPVVGDAFVGRVDSLQQLHNFLVAARQPSPVLLSGMRRIGKTSLLQQFHHRHKRPTNSNAVSVYLSLAELRLQLISSENTVSGTLYKAIGRALTKREFSANDHNREIGERLRQAVANSRWPSARAVVNECWDKDSLADSLMLLAERMLELLGGNTSRLIVLLDEAETLTIPYQQGGGKKVELEQLLQSLREISQTSDRFAMVLSGSNHITAFAQEYKNAFFGSCVDIELEGLTSVEDASRLIAPPRVKPYVEFDRSAIDYGIQLCAGMPQFMWQLGAATVFALRSGKALRSDVRAAVSAMVDGDHTRLPFRSYDVLEPIEHMLGLQGDRERDLLWLLLRRVALTSSLSAQHTPRHFLIESQLLEFDGRSVWNKRLQTLVDLKILVAEANSSYRFKVPLFAEGFRAARAEYDAGVRLRRLAA